MASLGRSAVGILLLALLSGFFGFSGSDGLSANRLPKPLDMLSKAFEISPFSESPTESDDVVVVVVVVGLVEKSSAGSPVVVVRLVGFGAAVVVVVVVVAVEGGTTPKLGNLTVRGPSVDGGLSLVPAPVFPLSFSPPLSANEEDAFPASLAGKPPREPDGKVREDFPALSLVFLVSVEVVVVLVDTAETSGRGDPMLKLGQDSIFTDGLASSVLCRTMVGESVADLVTC